ncbi:Uncharacterized protein SCF082_LOCUS34156 [Durusdinium trenchii]|uniref:Uncharacterized protein n=1 Tax=Durusdinium trenchii TaxID=1381693 RepID=A0ABP0NQE0_9DINO
MVTPCRDSTKGECTRCFYIRRGSFKKLKVAELRKALLKSKSLKDKFRGLRRKHIKTTTRNPRAKPRHEVVDVRHFTEKKDKNFCQIYQEGKWMSITDYVNEKVTDPQQKKKLKTLAQKRTYVTKDELGVEGVIILPDSKTKLVRIGAGVSTSRSKRSEYVDSKDASAAHDKIKHTVSMALNTKDCRGHVVGS